MFESKNAQALVVVATIALMLGSYFAYSSYSSDETATTAPSTALSESNEKHVKAVEIVENEVSEEITVTASPIESTETEALSATTAE